MTELTVKMFLRFPYYEYNKPPRYYAYHEDVDFIDELELVWGKRWGAQGIGKLREVVVVRPSEVEVNPIYSLDPTYFLSTNSDLKIDLEAMRQQHEQLIKTYKDEGITIHYMEYPEEPTNAYGLPMKRSISAAACFVINGGAIIPREGPPYWRKRAYYVTKFLASIGCPILYTVHGKGVCEIGAFTRMYDDVIVGMLSVDCNQEGLNQVKPILERCGYKEVWAAHCPGSLDYLYPEHIHWMHADMWIASVDVGIALIHPPFCDYETIRWLKSKHIELIEVPRDEQIKYYACNCLTIEPGKVVMAEGANYTRHKLESKGIDVIEIPYSEVMKYGGGIRCTTGTLVRDKGPTIDEVKK